MGTLEGAFIVMCDYGCVGISGLEFVGVVLPLVILFAFFRYFFLFCQPSLRMKKMMPALGRWGCNWKPGDVYRLLLLLLLR